MNFRFPVRFFTLCLLGAFVVSVSAAVEKPYEVGTWANFCQGAVTHGFDDNMNTNPNGDGQKIFDEKKFHMTLHVQTGSANWNNCKASFAKGHEISSHTVSHTSSASEVKQAYDAIKKNVPGELCATIAYPNCNTPGDAEVLKYHLAGRNCDGQTASSSPTNMAQISSKMFGSGSCGCPNDANSMNAFADQAVSKKGWSVYCHHGVTGESHTWAVTSVSALKSHLDYLDKNRGKIWIETMGNVARYIKERNAVSIAKKDSTDKGITITVTDDLADNALFNYPLTIRRPLPSGWTTAVVTQGGKEVKDTIIDGNVMFEAVPDGGDVVISKDAVAVIQGASGLTTDGTFPARLQRSMLLIDSRRFNGSALSVTLFDLTGKVLVRYTLGTNESRIVLPEDKISQSAFIAKITGGSKTWSGKFMPQM